MGGSSRRHRGLLAAAVFLLATALLSACGSSKTASTPTPGATATGNGTTTDTTPTPSTQQGVTLPDTPAGIQAKWLIDAATRAPIPDAEVQAHFDGAFLEVVSPAQLNQTFTGIQAIEVKQIVTNQPATLVFNVGITPSTAQQDVQVALAVDNQGLISGLHLGPAALPTPHAQPTTWSSVDDLVKSVAPQVRFLAAKLDNGTCTPVHDIDADTAAPLGSAFKLYVLDALGNAIKGGSVTWDQQLTITDAQKSIPSGTLQNEAAGTKVLVQDVATKMISISDNTGADMLIGLVGRSAVETNLAAAGMKDPSRNMPFLTTREMSILKLNQWPSLADQYVAADEAGRRTLLNDTVDKAPLPDLAGLSAWKDPRDIDSIEWFASPGDLCRVYGSLQGLAGQPGLSQVGTVLSVNDGGLALDKSKWKTTWFKGGSEPGVLTLAYMATTTGGQTYVVAALAENPKAPIDETNAAVTLISAIRGAFALAAGN